MSTLSFHSTNFPSEWGSPSIETFIWPNVQRGFANLPDFVVTSYSNCLIKKTESLIQQGIEAHNEIISLSVIWREPRKLLVQHGGNEQTIVVGE